MVTHDALRTLAVLGRRSRQNTNGPLRQYFPNGTDLSRWSAEDIEAVAHALNLRPRKTLGWNARRGLQRAPTLAPTSRCCIHRLNPVA
jgi:IS30 family transposase